MVGPRPTRQDPGQAYRDLMSSFPSGVAVVTALDEAGCPQGMTCTSLASVTVKPPTLLVSLRHGSATLKAVAAGGAFAVNLLHDTAQEVARLLAAPVPSRFNRIRWLPSANGAPWLIDDALGVADCLVTEVIDVGDHQVVFGQVTRAFLLGGSPLLYGLRQYGAWAVNGRGIARK